MRVRLGAKTDFHHGAFAVEDSTQSMLDDATCSHTI